MPGAPMERTLIGDLELEYEVVGAGEPVVLIHAGVIGAGWFDPLMTQPALRDRHRLLRYNRTGYGNSGRVTGSVTIADHAVHCHQLMRNVGIERAHVVGHSSSAMIALQLSLDFPAAVHILALLESARPAPASTTQAEFVTTVAAPAMDHYTSGDKPGAVDTWMRGVAGTGYRAVLDAVIPGAVAQAVADADTFFGQELPAVQPWSFTAADAARIAQPVLAVLGTNSVPTFAERRRLLVGWLPDIELFDLPGAGHLLHVENPEDMAAGLAAFFARHPIGEE